MEIIELIKPLFNIALTVLPFYILFNSGEISDYIVKKLKGFTLIELAIVVAIIGIVATTVLPMLGGAKDKLTEAPVQQTQKEQFDEHVDSDCVARYGKHACEYDAG